MRDVRLLTPSDSIGFEETVGVSIESQRLLAAWWADFSAGKPALFNGAVLACSSCELMPAGELRIGWYMTNYAHYMQRAATAPIVAPARAIFCSVALRATSGNLLVGRMARSTSSAGRVQLPGGNITCGQTGVLSVESCADDACTEFREEIGIALRPSQLSLWRVKVGGLFDDVGIIFGCDLNISERDICQAFDAHVQAEREAGANPEFEELLFLGSDYFRRPADGEWVDYLSLVTREIGLPLVPRGDP